MCRLRSRGCRIAEFCGCICLTLVSCGVARAQQGQALPVGVSFEFTDSQIANSFDNSTQRKHIEEQVAAQFIQRLQSRFHYWTFATSAPNAKVTLKLGLNESDSQAVTLWASLLNASTEVMRWKAGVFPPGELIRSGMPVP